MQRKIAIAISSLTLFILVGCAGTAGSLVSSLNPFAGFYSGTTTYTATSTNEPVTLNVSGSGRVTGTFVDPSLGNGSLAGNVAADGTVSGTTLIGSTPGTFSFTLTSASNNHFTGAGNFTSSGGAKAVTIDVVRS